MLIALRSVPALIAAALALASAVPAAARSRIAVVPQPVGTAGERDFVLDGVGLAGDRLLYAFISASTRAVEVVVGEPDGTTRSIVSARGDNSSGRWSASVTAADDLVWATRFTTFCGSDCKTEETASTDSWLGPVTGTLPYTIGCEAGDASCVPDGCAGGRLAFPSAIGGGRVAERCLFGPSSGFTVTKLGVGPAQPYPDELSPSLAGRYLASIALDPGHRQGGRATGSVVLRDLEAGTEVVRLPIPAEEDDDLANTFEAVFVQEDGTTLLNLPPTRPAGVWRAWWLSPDEPTLHPLSVPGRPFELEGGVIAYEPTNPRTGGSDKVELMDLAGRVVVSVPTQKAAFDGRRLATTTRPCARQFVVVRDRADPGPIPGPPVGGCPAPQISHRKLRSTPVGRVYVEVACPSTPALGCPGSLVLGRPGASTPISRPKGFFIQPGARATVGVRLRSAVLAELSRRRRMDVVVTSTTAPREGDTRTKVRRARVVLARPATSDVRGATSRAAAP